MRRICTILLCGVFVCVGAYVTTSPSYAAHWADQYLNNLVSQQIMRGDDEGNLYPDNSITRAEFVAMMNRAFGYSQKGSVSFNDVPEEAWYYDDIGIAKKQGYFTGIYPDTAGPDKPLKREEAVTMLCRALKIEGVQSDSLQFSDSRTFSSWSKDYINAAVEKHFLTGYPDQTFKPADYMKRGEMAKVLSDVAGEIVKEKGSNYIGYANGNVSVVQTGASLRNTIVPGDLYITAGMGTGYTELDNLTVGGDLIISGTGNAESGQVSVILTDCDIHNLVIDSGDTNTMSVRAEGGSVIETTTVKSNAYLEEDDSRGTAFKDVILKGPSGTTLNLSGDFDNVSVKAPNNKISVDQGTVDSLTVDEDAVKGSVFIQKDASVNVLYCDTATVVTGTGDIDEISINANGCNISMLPEHIYIRPGVTAIVNGQTMTSLDAEANNADPEFMDDYPKYEDLTSTSVKLLAKTNKPGKVYWAVKNIDLVASGMDEDEVMNPDKRYVVKSGTVSVVGEKEITINVGGLKSGTRYEYYMVFEDFKEETTDVEDEDFMTVDVVAPQFLNGTPRIVSSTKDSFTMVAMPSKKVTMYWAVLPNKAVPPTVESLSDLKVSGALALGSEANCAMNDPKEILMRGAGEKQLAESVTYDIYMVMEDDSDNLSRLAKVTGITLDQTNPEFIEGYPWNEPGAATALNIRHMSNEAGTLYWAVYPFDFSFPPVEDYDSITDSAIKKELQIRAITTGQKAVKNGKVTVTEKKDATLNIGGLAKQTPYDLYFVLMDKAGNYSEPKALKGVKTLDKTAPVASMDFDKVLEGNPLVSSNISVTFDEIVYYDGAEKDVRLTQVPADQKADVLKSMFSVHDLLSPSKPDYLADIDYDKVVIGEKDGKTVVTFPQEAFGGGTGLNSGGIYQFELNNVVDSDGNAMSQATLLKSFKIVAPQVYMTRYNGSATLANNEIGFSLKKADGVNSDKYFDVIIQTDQLITFDLYIDDESNGGAAATPAATGIRLEAGQARSVASMLSSSSYQPFMDVKNTHYRLAIRNFKAIDESRQNSWDGTLNIQAMAVIGEPYSLTNLGTDILNKKNPIDIVKNNADTVIVSNPEVFGVKRVYADSEEPQLIGDITYTTYDTAANVVFMTDKAATLYYVVTPKVNVDGKAAPTVDQILAGQPSYLNSQHGQINILDGQVEYQQLLEGLTPETAYKFFYVLKGQAADKLTVKNAEVDADGKFTADFTTTEELTPILTEGPVPSGTSNTISVEMLGTANTPTKVYWVMYTGGAYTNSSGTTSLTPEQVIQLSNTDGTVVDSGNFSVTTANDLNELKDGLQFAFTCKNMEPTKTYDVFVALQSEYSNKISPQVYFYKNVRSKDATPPYIVSTATTIKSYSTNSNTNITKYKGTVTVRFSEPLYYKNSLAGDEMYPLTMTDLVNTNGGSAKEDGLITFDSTGVTVAAKVYSTSDGDNGKYPITGIDFTFTGIQDGSTIGLNAEIYDRGGWRAGQFVMTFVENEADRKKSHFEVEFVTGEKKDSSTSTGE
ncbi:S-layer homology domain-containing protein [Aminipila luticellarii]|uniref:S-layer homology domain-containing protein n=1 Tax=Aminipila luticellarii TaxID=2507160 RepID=A0A410PT31_9FIRM|nr:S-layer homology domain-containing protein [Aminipila luticellarii]QAT42028.1 S-layer homology domain-containing protein [Aminipila luticellarii]